MDQYDVCREIISLCFSVPDPDIHRIKVAVCKKYALPAVPKHSLLLACALPSEREVLLRLLQVKPTRTLSGVAPVAVMTSPAPCPHGKCLPCPGGPDHPFQSPQSYTGEEPAALRAREHAYDPYAQVQARLGQFEALGHAVDKAELIVMGGTMTARPHEYQEWFVTSCIRAMNEYGQSPSGTSQEPESVFRKNQTDAVFPENLSETIFRKNQTDAVFPENPSETIFRKNQTEAVFTENPSEVVFGKNEKEAVFRENETAPVRCVAMTFETRPDWCRKPEIDRMLELGVTKVELGVQHVDDRILAYNRRGCTVADTVHANCLLRDAGLKVGFHIMPNMPGSTMEDDRRLFSELFADDGFRPDFLKIYPTLVTPGSEIEALWRQGAYACYNEEDLIGLIAYGKSLLPRYVRLQRIQRDIPAKLIVEGSRHSNFRQLAKDRLEAEGGRCRCIRCREIGRLPSGAVPESTVERYSCCGGEEQFISIVSADSLVGFARLRTGGERWRPETEGAALLRELHVYGSIVPIGRAPGPEQQQHRQFGRQLLEAAGAAAGDAGYRKIAVMSGIGVRPWYRRHGYHRNGPYMIRDLP